MWQQKGIIYRRKKQNKTKAYMTISRSILGIMCIVWVIV